MVARADQRRGSLGYVTTRARALNKPQKISAVSKELLVTNIWEERGHW